mgnify:CR=1 FL=1
MVKGTTVIFNDEYVDEIIRHRDISKKKYENENMESIKAKHLKNYKAWEQKLDWALNFQDTVDSFINVEVPSITVCKTMGGLELPAKHLQVI